MTSHWCHAYVCLPVILSSSINAGPVSVGGLISLETSERSLFSAEICSCAGGGGSRDMLCFGILSTHCIKQRLQQTGYERWSLNAPRQAVGGNIGSDACRKGFRPFVSLWLHGEWACYKGVEPPCVAVRLNLNTEWRRKQPEQRNFDSVVKAWEDTNQKDSMQNKRVISQLFLWSHSTSICILTWKSPEYVSV